METYKTSPAGNLGGFQATMFAKRNFLNTVSEMPFDLVDIKELGFDPGKPTGAHPGSRNKVTTLAARYAVGLPLWHDNDCNDHALTNDDSS